MNNINFSSFATFQKITPWANPATRLKYLLSLDFTPVTISDLFRKHGLDFSDYEEGTCQIAEVGDFDVIMAKELDRGWEVIAISWGEISSQETYTITLTHREDF